MKETRMSEADRVRQIINVIKRSLSSIDERLVEHGERVAYIAGKIAEADESLQIDRKKLFMLCLLHDIGAYKTEEIDDMVGFETEHAMNHAIYGYVFLSNTTDLGESSEAILYHHTPYNKLEEIKTPCRLEAELIFLADRIDIALLTTGKTDWEPLKRLSGTIFSPALLELFFKAEASYDISGHILAQSYSGYIQSRIDSVNLSEAEATSYLKMLVYSIDFRSPFTVTHTANTTAISVALAKLFDLSEDECEAIKAGAFLHDIGKISIPYAILESPGKLTEEEMAVMRTHVTISEEILSGIVSDEVCKNAVRHHERPNGTGYSRGLDGSSLTLPQRIIAVADVISALTGRRSYKEPFAPEKTISILRRMGEAGDLCPEVCAMAIERFDVIQDIANRIDNPIGALYETIRSQYSELVAKSI